MKTIFFNIQLPCAACLLTILASSCQSTPTPAEGQDTTEQIQSLIDGGIQLGEEGKYNQAIRQFEKVLELDPVNIEAYSNLAVAYFRKGDYESAVQSLTHAIDNGRNDAEAYFFRGLIYGKHMEQDAKAIPDLTKAIELDPTRERAYLNRGLSYFMLGQYEEAITDLTTLLEMDPTNGKFVFDWRAKAYVKVGRYEEAWAEVREAENRGYPIPPDTLAELRKASGQNN